MCGPGCHLVTVSCTSRYILYDGYMSTGPHQMLTVDQAHAQKLLNPLHATWPLRNWSRWLEWTENILSHAETVAGHIHMYRNTYTEKTTIIKQWIYTYQICRISTVPAWNCRIKYQFLFWRKWELEYLHNIKTSPTLIVCNPFSLNINANAKLKFLFTILTKHYPNVVTEHMFIGHLAHIGSYIGYMCNCIHGHHEHVCIILYIILVN